MATAVLESDITVDAESERDGGPAPWPRVLVGCAVCGLAHPRGDESDPGCPVEGL